MHKIGPGRTFSRCSGPGNGIISIGSIRVELVDHIGVLALQAVEDIGAIAGCIVTGAFGSTQAFTGGPDKGITLDSFEGSCG